MVFDLDMIKGVYAGMEKSRQALEDVRQALTLTERILFPFFGGERSGPFGSGKSYVNFDPDRVAMQDATAQMALLQFMPPGPERWPCPHRPLRPPHPGAARRRGDLAGAWDFNKEVYRLPRFSPSAKYGIGFWKPGSGSSTRSSSRTMLSRGDDDRDRFPYLNAGGLGMIAIGVGGADAVDVMAGMPWELKFPKLIGVQLKGKMSGWTSAKDVILKVAGILTVKGGTGAIVEYFGEGPEHLRPGKGTICNMGAEIGATTSFSVRCADGDLPARHGRAAVADDGRPDRQRPPRRRGGPGLPEKYFDQVIEIDLTELEPISTGRSPRTLHEDLRVCEAVEKTGSRKNWSCADRTCTNSSYEDITRERPWRTSYRQGAGARSEFTITPGSEQVRATIERDGYLRCSSRDRRRRAGQCMRPVHRTVEAARHRKGEKNSIMTSFNRNFAARNDGNPVRTAFVASPEIVTAMAIAGTADIQPVDRQPEN